MGDTLAFETEHARVIYQNINGIKHANGFGECAIIGDAAREMGASIIGMVETCLDWSNQETLEKCKRLFKNSFNPQVNMSVSSSEETYETPYQPGGTATVVGGNWAGRTTSHCDNSGMGRWSELRMTGKDNTAIRFITAYRVVESSFARAGPTTAFSQQYSIMEDKGIINPDPRAAVLQDLGKHIELAIEQGDEVCLMIDANESMCDQGGKFSKWVYRIGLCDIMVQRHGTENEPATFIGGSKRIDYILMTEKLTEYVTATGVLEEIEFHESDHRALYVDMDLESFFGGSPSPMESSANRGLVSSDPRAVKTYREKLEKKMEEGDIERKLDELLERIKAQGFLTIQSGDELDALDKAFTEMKLWCEKECKKAKSFPWSPELRDARNKVRYWKLWLSQVRRKCDYSAKMTMIDPVQESKIKSVTKREIQSRLR
jgi:hypothetical protein